MIVWLCEFFDKFYSLLGIITEKQAGLNLDPAVKSVASKVKMLKIKDFVGNFFESSSHHYGEG